MFSHVALSCFKLLIEENSFWHCEDGNDKVLSTINVDEIEDIDYEIDDSKDHSLKVSEYDIIPGFIGWVQYGGNMLPGKVITSNKRGKKC